MGDRPTHDPVALASSMAWERAKGELASMVAAEGSRYGAGKYEGSSDDVFYNDGEMKFQVMRRQFDEFIRHIEEHELHM